MTLPPNENSSNENFLSDPDEIKKYAHYIIHALTSTDPAGRRQALVDGVLRFGNRFSQSLDLLAQNMRDRGPYEELRAETEDILARWALGEQLSEQVDEDERRLQVADVLLGSGNEDAERLVVRSLLALPEGHPRRDTAFVCQALRRFLERSRTSGEVDKQMQAINDLLFHRLEPHDQILELIREGRGLVGRVSDQDHQLTFRRNALVYLAMHAHIAREEGRADEQRELEDQAQEVFEELRLAHPDFLTTPSGLQITAVIMGSRDREQEAVASAASAVDASTPGDKMYEEAAILESHYRMMRDEYERVVKILEPLLPFLEEKYLTAVREAAIAKAGVNFSEVTRTLAFAYAHLGRWDEAVRILERGKSLRLRYRAALRRTPEGKRLLELETKLYALGRGVPAAGGESDAQRADDYLAAQVSPENRVLEEYRKQRPRLSSELLAAPAVADIARSLEEDQAVVILGVAKSVGTLIAVVCRGDEEQPSGRFLLKDWPLHRWADVFAGEQQDGWIFTLNVPGEEVACRAALLGLLKAADEVIGQTVLPLLRERGVRRVTIIPHHWFHFVPLWALPSIEDYDVMVAASATHFMEARQEAKAAGRRVLIVADPTYDLSGSLTEAEAVTSHFTRLNFGVVRLDGEQATEDAVVAALPGVSVLHFCGHGRSDMSDPERSALLLAPQLGDAPASGDPFAFYAAAAQDWQAKDNGWRSAVIPGFGRLYEQLTEEGMVLERRLEYGERGSLWGRYHDGGLAQLAELWTAGDILVNSPLGDCRLAFLSACEAGTGSLSTGVDEYSGLPAALQLAGVATVVCSLWPVSDVLTALYVDLFYRTLAEAPQPADVGSVVRQVGLLLRRMTREQAVVLLNRLKQQTTSPDARFDFEAFAGRIAAGEPHPFEHPYDWAAFYATGASRILFRQGDAS